MAGEASAIIAIAQLGISLFTTLIGFVGEVKDTAPRVQRIGNEILTTSERLKEIGDLVSKNPQTKVFSSQGIQCAKRCSYEYERVIAEVRVILGKTGRRLSPTFDTRLTSMRSSGRS
jgi:hypothetical protein